MTKIVGITGSLRNGSFNTALLRAAKELVPHGVALEIATLKGIPLYDGDIEAIEGVPPAVARTNCRCGWIIAGYAGIQQFHAGGIQKCDGLAVAASQRSGADFRRTPGCGDRRYTRWIRYSTIPKCLVAGVTDIRHTSMVRWTVTGISGASSLQ